MSERLKLIGVIVKTETNDKNIMGKKGCLIKIYINTSLPSTSNGIGKNDESKLLIKKLLSADEKMSKKMTSMSLTDEGLHKEEITEIKTYKPFYRNKYKNMIVKINIPKKLSDVNGLSALIGPADASTRYDNLYGRMVEINSVSQIYSFTDKTDKSKNIRGWKMKMISIRSI